MRRFNHSSRRARPVRLALLSTAALGLISAVASLADIPDNAVTLDQVTRGRYEVVSRDCADCHNRGKTDASDPRWLAGYLPGTPGQPFQIGPFKTYPANLTPDPETGLGKLSDRQIFNAIRFGLDPSKTPDVVITSSTPGQGNFPAAPVYLAPPMPWPFWRHMTDEDLWAVVAYIKHGIKPVSNKVPDSEGPPPGWASIYTPDVIGPYPLPAYPSSNEEFKP